ncbi:MULTISPECIES: type IV pilus biogenesis/stability protein PilW [Pseudomonas]|jgi:type IV pilus assembly protein PilF|uniref:Type IV pilus biogenesis/stability protein PilW n=1 Tax=Pseudomonas coleopterorum TaxID=1605838 RepID=A0ABR9BSD1_9PSED|nr:MULTISPECIES: type IV pilus biogenesis/stability protein PilW [Pseudomonas]KNC06984.1 pilus assembly protein PilW [Pseudomonas sp. RIT-PI-a]MBD8754958.1 type IV pilus biogenesis/stability protein PilW [Pseudomonas coleopterorum]MBD8768046.1 type IV pilus biogenesis/stability protein PilW [Pseudomonas coleopterorum]MDY1017976.1 type IV pilus biogenesis/stability protein PilW [Pseudomonas coleopterorum]MDY1049080.1 type IV pilus biogenesis/stability protein PilW [Pseudomonas coleopterorum]
MTLRAALLIVFALLTGCVTTGKVNPMDTSKGRDEARQAYVQLGLGYLQEGSTERAKIPLKKALELNGSDADANAALALVFQAEMEPELAEQHFRKALNARSDARILNNYGSFLYEQKRYKEAYELFEKAAADTLYPERSRVFENLGMTAAALGQREVARQNLEKALRLNRQQPRALLEMAEMSYQDMQYVPAKEYYDRFTQLSEQTARSLLLGTRLAKVYEDKNKAASYGLQLKRLYPGTPEYQQYLSEQR